MIEIIPNWHPILVHFTIALLTISVALHIVVLFAKTAPWRGTAMAVARWNLGLGLGLTVLTVAAGLYAAATVAHDDAAHLEMTSHRNWALLTFGAFALLALWHWLRFRGRDQVNPLFVGGMVLAGLLLAVTGFKGADLVYEHGLGVESLPQVSGEGHDHDHDHSQGDASSEGPPEPATETSVTASSGDGHNHIHAADLPSEGPAGAVNAFHAAMRAGDREGVLSYLASEAVIYESGFAERSRDEYASAHLDSDIAFMSAIKTEYTAQEVHAMGDMAMVLSESRSHGTFRERDIDHITLETAILHETPGGWKIIHLHWGGRAAGEGH